MSVFSSPEPERGCVRRFSHAAPFRSTAHYRDADRERAAGLTATATADPFTFSRAAPLAQRRICELSLLMRRVNPRMMFDARCSPQ